MFSSPHVILLQPAKFRHNQAIHGMGYDVISNLQDGGHRVRNLLPGSGLVMAPVLESGYLFAYQISMRYLNARLR